MSGIENSPFTFFIIFTQLNANKCPYLNGFNPSNFFIHTVMKKSIPAWAIVSIILFLAIMMSAVMGGRIRFILGGLAYFAFAYLLNQKTSFNTATKLAIGLIPFLVPFGYMMINTKAFISFPAVLFICLAFRATLLLGKNMHSRTAILVFIIGISIYYYSTGYRNWNNYYYFDRFSYDNFGRNAPFSVSGYQQQQLFFKAQYHVCL